MSSIKRPYLRGKQTRILRSQQRRNKNTAMEISGESELSVKACSFHQRKSIPDTEIIYSRLLETIGSQRAFFLNFSRNLPQHPCCSIRATGITIDKHGFGLAQVSS